MGNKVTLLDKQGDFPTTPNIYIVEWKQQFPDGLLKYKLGGTLSSGFHHLSFYQWTPGVPLGFKHAKGAIKMQPHF